MKLTERQCEIMELLKKGYDSKAISKRLFVTVATVKAQINAIYNKYNLCNIEGRDKKILAIKIYDNENIEPEKNFTIKNCPALSNYESSGVCLSEETLLINPMITSGYCKDYPDCVMKQLIEMLNNQNLYKTRVALANAIKKLLKVEE